MSIPLPETDNSQRAIAGDYKDDDARVIDSLIEAEANPPTDEEKPLEPIRERPAVGSRPINRLLSNTLRIDPSWGPQLLLPADPFRQSVNINVSAVAEGADTVMIADDAGKIQGGITAGAFILTTGSQSLGGYTGPVWAVAVARSGGVAGAPVLVTACAVTGGPTGEQH